MKDQTMIETEKTLPRPEVNLANLGQAVVAYVRPVPSPTGVQFTIHAADGQILGVAPDQSAALGAIIANGLRPIRLN
jgi:hypothetical protein